MNAIELLNGLGLSEELLGNARAITVPDIDSDISDTTICISSNVNTAANFVSTPSPVLVGPHHSVGRSVMDLIQHINIQCTKSDLEQAMDNHYSGSSWHSFKEMNTRQGKTLLLLTDDTKPNANILMNYDKTTGQLDIKPFKMSSRNFYQELSENIMETLMDLAVAHKGDFVGIFEDTPKLIIKGIHSRAVLAVAKEGDPLPFGREMEDIDRDSTSVGSIKINKTIKEYLNENPDLAKVTPKPYPDNVNYLAKTLMQKKINGEIEFPDFLDLFRQCVLLGANDPTVMKFYQLLKI